MAILINARTFMPDGSYAGTFNNDTRPTDSQVSAIISHTCSIISGYVGAIVSQADQDSALTVASLGAAAMVEMSFFPEQVEDGKSAYPDLDARYDEQLQLLRYNVAEGDQGESMTPQFGFPNTTALAQLPPPNLPADAMEATDWLTQF